MTDEAKLIFRSGIENERSEPAEAVCGIVNYCGGRRIEAEVGAVAVEAGVVCEAAGVPPEAELIVGLIEIANGKSEFGYVVTFEAGTLKIP